MGISLRIFFINEDDSIQHFALARYERLHERDSKERLPEYAGKRVRYALVVLDLVDREPIEILRIQYSFLDFDSEGRIDPDEGRKEARLAFEILPPLPIMRNPWEAVEARRCIPKKRHDDKNKWLPTPEIEKEIVDAVFGKK